MKILFDAMGGDNAPDANIKGAINAAKKIDGEIILLGKESLLKERIRTIYSKELSDLAPNISIVNTTETIEMDDVPTVAIKTKKDSSMVVGFRMLKDGEADAFVSAGNSGALLTGATLLVGRIKGIDRPALAGILPVDGKGMVLMDSGANTNCRPINLLQFAVMANVYIKNTFNIPSPKIALLNNGTEETKGNELMKESYKLIKENAEKYNIDFVGNIEGRDVFAGSIDGLITDGWTGNIFLKGIEGVGKLVKKTLSDSLKQNIFTKIGAIGALPALKQLASKLDYKEYGGALFLGVKKPIVKAHGSSDAYVFEKTLLQAKKFVDNNMVDKITKEIETMHDGNFIKKLLTK